jgi:DNA-binding NarL/FixJ family response regulator
VSIDTATLEHHGRAPDDNDGTGAAAKLTRRELEVIRHLASGATARQIGSALHISSRTVESHIFNAYRKLGVHSRVQLVRLMLEGDLLAAAPSAEA